MDPRSEDPEHFVAFVHEADKRSVKVSELATEFAECESKFAEEIHILLDDLEKTSDLIVPKKTKDYVQETKEILALSLIHI